MDSLLALVALDAHGRREFAIGAPLRLLFLYDSARAGTASQDDVQAWHASLLQRFHRVFGELSPGAMLYKPSPPWQGEGNPDAANFLPAFEAHFADAASTAELRALVHARVVFADGDLGRRFEAVRQSALGRERSVDAVGAALSALRPRDGGGRWDVLERPRRAHGHRTVRRAPASGDRRSRFAFRHCRRGAGGGPGGRGEGWADRRDGRCWNWPARLGCGRTSTASCAWWALIRIRRICHRRSSRRWRRLAAR